MMRSLVGRVLQHGQVAPTREALVSQKAVFTYGELSTHVVAAADWLSGHGVTAGDRVLIAAGPADPWFAVAYLATHLRGAIAVPVDSKAASGTRRGIELATSPALVLADTAFNRFRAEVAQTRQRAGDGAETRIEPNAVADILFTTGSTGQPKGVALSHANIVAATRNIVKFIGNDASDREVVTVPLSHSFGLGRMRCVFHVGGTLILVPGLSFPALVFRELERHSATGLSCVPAGAAVLLQQGEQRLAQFASQLRYMELGSAPMEASAKRRLANILPRTRICMHYGLTEASRSAFLEFHADAHRIESIGRASPNVDIRIMSEEGPLAHTGAVGRIQIKADTVMQRYWKDPEQTRRAFSADGWLETGDLGRLDADGYLYLAGRSDDLINVGGKKVYPLTVERVANAFPGVSESACAAIPDPDQILGDVAALWVVEASPNAVDVDALRAAIARELEVHAVPRCVHVVGEIPKTTSGKILRAKLRHPGA